MKLDQDQHMNLKGVRDGFLKSDQLEFITDDVVKKAFNKSKDMVPNDDDDLASDLIGKAEFRYFLKFLRHDYEYWYVFTKMDLDGKKGVTKDEFLKAKPVFEEFKYDSSDLNKTWDSIKKVNADQMTYHEFADWAEKTMMLED